VRLAQKKSIFKAIAFPYPFEESDVEAANRYITQAFYKNQELLIPFWLISPSLTETMIRQNNIRGLKEHFYLSRNLDKRHFFPAYDLLRQSGLFLIIHPHMKERVEKIQFLKENFPQLKIILAHSGRKWPFSGEEVLERVIPALKGYEDLYFDTSTIRDSRTIAGMVRAVGSERILFGSDYPFFREEGEDVIEVELAPILKADISDGERENILTNNLKRLFMEGVWTRRGSREDREELLAMIAAVDPRERKFLALDQKMDVIRSNIRDERHIYVIENSHRLLGFARESGRPDNGALLEEIYLLEEERHKGYAHLLTRVITDKFAYVEAKTFAENRSVAALFRRLKFSVEKTSKNGNILYWKRIDE
jgi:predicted TIM-barrel fold metal-dependent hydrolase